MHPMRWIIIPMLLTRKPDTEKVTWWGVGGYHTPVQ